MLEDNEHARKLTLFPILRWMKPNCGILLLKKWRKPQLATLLCSCKLHAITCTMLIQFYDTPESKVHGANMGPTWVLSAPDGPNVSPMKFAIRDHTVQTGISELYQTVFDTQMVYHKMQHFISHKINLTSHSVHLIVRRLAKADKISPLRPHMAKKVQDKSSGCGE